jgi:hypothetical protein
MTSTLAASGRRVLPVFCISLTTSMLFTFGLMGADGIAVTNNFTVPRGGVWLDGALGGHFWQTDSVLGICRIDPLNGANPPFHTVNLPTTNRLFHRA